MNNLIPFLIKKLFYFISVLLGTTFLVFILIKIAPGDPYQGWSEQLKAQFFVDKPFVVQYFIWLSNLFLLDLGVSIKTGQPVFTLVVKKYFTTSLIAFGGLLVALLVAIPLSYFSTYRQNSKIIHATIKTIELISAAPVFIIGYLIFFIFLSQFNWNLNYRANFSILQTIIFYISVFIILGLGNGTVIEFIEHFQNELTTIKNKMYMTAVRARAINYFKHLVKNITIPILTIITSRFVFLLSSAVIVEKLFTLQGAGLLSIDAAEARDYPVILGITVLTVFIVFLLKLISDIVIHSIYAKK